MKKVILGIAIVGLGAFSTLPAMAQEVNTTKTSAQQGTVVIPTPPQFENAEANTAVGELVTLLNTYAPSIKAADTAKIVEFSSKIQVWQQNAASWVTALSPADKEKLDAYMRQVDAALQGDDSGVNSTPEAVPPAVPDDTDAE